MYSEAFRHFQSPSKVVHHGHSPQPQLPPAPLIFSSSEGMWETTISVRGLSQTPQPIKGHQTRLCPRNQQPLPAKGQPVSLSAVLTISSFQLDSPLLSSTKAARDKGETHRLSSHTILFTYLGSYWIWSRTISPSSSLSLSKTF